MQQTAHQPVGSGWSPEPPPISDRPEQSYHGKKERTALDKLVLCVVVAIAGIVIALSTRNTAMLAHELSLNPYLTAGLVEILFASLLFIRGRQRATQRNVPLFLSIGYFLSLGFVTGVNMYGLYQENPMVGPIVGGAISGAMWLMESVLVWLWVDSHKPHEKSLRELKREAKREREKMKLIQQIEWMRWEAQKPDLGLIRKARETDEKRREVVRDGLPEFFRLVDPNTQTVSGLLEKSNTREDDTGADTGQTDSVDSTGVDTGQTDSVDSTGVDTGQTDSVDSTGVDTRQTDSVDSTGVDTRQTDSVDTAGVDTGQTDSVDSTGVDTRQTDSVDSTGVDTGQTDSVDSTGIDTGQTDSVDTAGVDTGQTDSVDSTGVDTGQTDSVDTAGVDTGQTDSVDSTGVDTGQTDSVDSTGVDTGQTDSVDTKVTHISKRKPAYEIALKYFEEHGKFPSYRDLGELAGCSKDTAGKAIKKAKERLKQTG